MYHYLPLLFLMLNPVFTRAQATDIIELGKDKEDVYVVRDYVECLQDTNNDKVVAKMFTDPHFEIVGKNIEDLVNTNKSYAYWIRFLVVNNGPSNLYRLEMFDHDIDEVSLYYKRQDSIAELHSGYSKKFGNRDLYHKNIGFLLSLPPGDTTTFVMRFKSHKSNVLEPVIRSMPAFYQYSVVEYTLLGFFYGFTFVIILYNLVYFFILRKGEYLFYLLYMLSITLYLMSTNGTGFQFLWPESPGINRYIEILLSTAGSSFLLLFTNSYLSLKTKNKKASILLKALVVVNLCLIPIQIVHGMHLMYLVISIVFIHVAFGVSLWSYLNKENKRTWLLLGFVFLDIGFVLNWLTHLHAIPSSVFTVYSLYLAINLQFICTSIDLALSIRHLNNEKEGVLMELLETADKNQMMRILALKKQMSPHFIFNSLNSILQRILSGDKKDASDYLVKFSKLIRKTLENSDALYSSVADELEALKLYLSLETMRLGHTFNYTMVIAHEVKAETEMIPSFIIQPFVENSIWHGLMPKEGEKNLHITIHKEESILIIAIEDNGIGRKKSALLRKDHQPTSFGTKLIMERVELLNKKHEVDTSIEILDLYDTENEAAGTKVIIKTTSTHEQLH